MHDLLQSCTRLGRKLLNPNSAGIRPYVADCDHVLGTDRTEDDRAATFINVRDGSYKLTVWAGAVVLFEAGAPEGHSDVDRGSIECGGTRQDRDLKIADVR